MDEPIPLLDRRNDKGEAYSQQSEVGKSRKFDNVRTINLTGFFKPFILVWQDIKSLSKYGWGHKRPFWLNIIAGLSLTLTLASTGLSQLLLSNKDYLTTSPYCPPGGDFDFRSAYNPWDLKHLFQITLGFGELSFAQAKAIDIVWDVVVGRGGQFILSIITFVVFSKCIVRLMEREGEFITYGTFRAIIFEEPSLRSTARLTLDLRSRLDWRARASIVWFILASIYVVAFPTLLSAMTGYSANVDAFFRLDNSQRKTPIDASNTRYFHRAIYTVDGGSRIKNANISDPFSDPFSATFVVGSKGYGFNRTDIEEDYDSCLVYIFLSSYPPYECAVAAGISEYIRRYGTVAVQNTNSVLYVNMTTRRYVFNVSAPTLDIKVYNTSRKTKPIWKLSVGKMLAGQDLPFFYTTDGNTIAYEEKDMSERGTCDGQTKYNWGFSFLLLFSFFSLTSVWVLGMYVMWSETYWNSRLDRVSRQMGFYRGIADISNAMWKDMLRKPTELASESTIRKMLEAQCNNGKIEFEHIDRRELPVPRKVEFRAWRKEITLLSGWSETWTVAHWIWFMVFSILTTGSAFMVAFFFPHPEFGYRSSAGDFLVCLIGFSIVSIFGPAATAMFFTGLACTLRRWTIWLVGLSRRRSRRGHQRISDSAGDSAEPLRHVSGNQTTP